MDFPLIDLMDQRACYDRLVDMLHPGGLACPRRHAGDRLGIHRRHRDPALDYQCGRCGRVFNAFTGTPLQGIRRPPAQLLLILRGIADAAPTAQMARELGCDRKAPARAAASAPGQCPARAGPQPAGRRGGRGRRGRRQRGGKKASRTPTRPTRRDGGPTAAAATAPSPTIDRRWPASSGGTRVRSAWKSSSRPAGRSWRRSSTTGLPGGGDGQHRRVAGLQPGGGPAGPGPRDGGPLGPQGDVGAGPGWGRDPRGALQHAGGAVDGLRIFLSRFRGVSKWYLAQYVAIFQWSHNLKSVTDGFLRILLGMWPSTSSTT